MTKQYAPSETDKRIIVDRVFINEHRLLERMFIAQADTLLQYMKRAR